MFQLSKRIFTKYVNLLYIFHIITFSFLGFLLLRSFSRCGGDILCGAVWRGVVGCGGDILCGVVECGGDILQPFDDFTKNTVKYSDKCNM